MAKSKRSKHERAMRRLLREKLAKKDEAKRLAALKSDSIRSIYHWGSLGESQSPPFLFQMLRHQTKLHLKVIKQNKCNSGDLGNLLNSI